MNDSLSNVLFVLGEVLVVLGIALLFERLLSRLMTALSATAVVAKHGEWAKAVKRRLRLFLVFGALLLVLLIVGFNGLLLLLVRGETDLAGFALEQLRGVPVDFWLDLALAVGKILALVIANTLVLRLIRRLLDDLGKWINAIDGIKANDESVEQFVASTKRLATRATWLGVLALAALSLSLPEAVYDTLLLWLRIYLIIAFTLVFWRAIDMVIETLAGLSEKYAHRRDLKRHYERLKPLVPLFRRTVEYVLYLSAATLVLAQLELTAVLARWGPRLIKIVGLFFLSRVAIEVVNLLLDDLFARARLAPNQRQRRMTFLPLIRSAVKYSVYFVFLICALAELGIDPKPVLAGAGILGLAVGLGAQSLITDLVSGFFILFEEYFLVGDFIEAGEARGLVESIDLRTTRIRDSEGRHHIVRNGGIDKIVSYSKEYSLAVVEVGVPFGNDIEAAVAALTEAGRLIHQTSDDVLEPPQVQGVEAFAESGMILRTVTKVRAGSHRQVERDLRRQIKKTFDVRSIEISGTVSLENYPFPVN